MIMILPEDNVVFNPDMLRRNVSAEDFAIITANINNAGLRNLTESQLKLVDDSGALVDIAKPDLSDLPIVSKPPEVIKAEAGITNVPVPEVMQVVEKKQKPKSLIDRLVDYIYNLKLF